MLMLARLVVYAGLVAALAGGCGGKPQLMATPNLYAWGAANPFEDVPEALRSNQVEVLYYTDRVAEGPSADQPDYGYQRSRSPAFGACTVAIGRNVSWERLVKASRSKHRDVSLPLEITRVRELGRFAPTPRKLFDLANAHAAATQPTDLPGHLDAEEAFRRELSARLAQTPDKEVFIFVHGFGSAFRGGVITIGQLWHFLGRRGVPIAYSWPAGSPSLLRAYLYDRESSEFTVYHFKQMLRLIASCPDVQKMNIISHSRGTAVVMSALRELHLEIRGSGRSTREELKLGTVVLAAPDLDYDVVIQRLATERIGQVPEHCVVYICSADEALGLSDWLFRSKKRFGQLRSTMFDPAEVDEARKQGTLQTIDARVSDAGFFGHDYFYSNPAVSSDLILLLRYKLPPGAEHGRPLRVTKHSFWGIDDLYPGPPREVNAQAAKAN